MGCLQKTTSKIENIQNPQEDDGKRSMIDPQSIPKKIQQEQECTQMYSYENEDQYDNARKLKEKKKQKQAQKKKEYQMFFPKPQWKIQTMFVQLDSQPIKFVNNHLFQKIQSNKIQEKLLKDVKNL